MRLFIVNITKKNITKENTFKEWVNMHSDELFSWAYHKTSSRETAEDLVQETFISAYKAFDSFKQESKPKTWLFRILNNKIIDYYRKSSKMKTDSIEAKSVERTNDYFEEDGHWKNLESNWEEDVHLLDNPEFLAVFGTCIENLPEKWNAVIKAKYIIHQDAKTVCKELGITPSNYWQMVHRAKIQLKSCIESKWKL